MGRFAMLAHFPAADLNRVRRKGTYPTIVQDGLRTCEYDVSGLWPAMLLKPSVLRA
jgi:hypothetical protein